MKCALIGSIDRTCFRTRIRPRHVAAFILCFAMISPVSAQQVHAWKKPQSQSVSESLPTIRVALKPSAQCFKNIVELEDVADLSGSESILQSIRSLPLGPAPVRGNQQTWLQEDVLYLLKLRGLDEKCIRWAGEDACQVVRLDTIQPSKAIEYASSDVSPQANVMAERTVASVISNYLKTKSSDAASWTIKPIIAPEYVKLLSQKRTIKGIAGGVQPWTGEQQFDLLLVTPQGEQAYRVKATVQVPTMVYGSTGPLAKGHVVNETDLKLVKLTPAMKAAESDCFLDPQGMIGKELRRSISTGQPILHADLGPARSIQARDLVEIHVVAGAVVAQTAGRALQSGGVDEVIEVEVVGTKKRLAARIVEGNIVEAIAR